MAIASGAVYCHRNSSPGKNSLAGMNNNPTGPILSAKMVWTEQFWLIILISKNQVLQILYLKYCVYNNETM